MKKSACILVSMALLGALHAPGLRAQEAGSVLDGVYTEEQAERGESTFENVCSYCHSDSEFSGSGFVRSWSGASVGQFYGLLAATMPYDGPGSLSQQQYTDVVAYILSINDFPTGDSELPANPDALDGIAIEESESSDGGP